MYAAKGTQAYAQIGVESAVMSASQQQLVTMLFDGVLSALVRARLFMQDNNQQVVGTGALHILPTTRKYKLGKTSHGHIGIRHGIICKDKLTAWRCSFQVQCWAVLNQQRSQTT